MKIKYYAIKDVKAGEFGELIFARNDEVAKRLFAQTISKNPMLANDLQLYFIGWHHIDTGEFESDFSLLVDNVVEDSNKE